MVEGTLSFFTCHNNGKKEWYTGEGEGESGAAIRRLFNTGDRKDARHRSIKKVANDINKVWIRKNKKFKAKLKAELFTAFERGEEESPSNQQAGFWCMRNFRGEQDNTVSNSGHM